MDFNKSPRVSSDEQGESREDWEPYLADYGEDHRLSVPLGDMEYGDKLANLKQQLEKSDKPDASDDTLSSVQQSDSVGETRELGTTGFSAEYARAGDNAESFLTGVMPHEGVGQEVADDNTNTNANANANAKVETKGESQMPELEQGDAYEQLSESEKLEAERLATQDAIDMYMSAMRGRGATLDDELAILDQDIRNDPVYRRYYDVQLASRSQRILRQKQPNYSAPSVDEAEVDKIMDEVYSNNDLPNPRVSGGVETEKRLGDDGSSESSEKTVEPIAPSSSHEVHRVIKMPNVMAPSSSAPNSGVSAVGNKLQATDLDQYMTELTGVLDDGDLAQLHEELKILDDKDRATVAQKARTRAKATYFNYLKRNEVIVPEEGRQEAFDKLPGKDRAEYLAISLLDTVDHIAALNNHHEDSANKMLLRIAVAKDLQITDPNIDDIEVWVSQQSLAKQAEIRRAQAKWIDTVHRIKEAGKLKQEKAAQEKADGRRIKRVVKGIDSAIEQFKLLPNYDKNRPLPEQLHEMFGVSPDLFTDDGRMSKLCHVLITRDAGRMIDDVSVLRYNAAINELSATNNATPEKQTEALIESYLSALDTAEYWAQASARLSVSADLDGKLLNKSLGGYANNQHYNDLVTIDANDDRATLSPVANAFINSRFNSYLQNPTLDFLLDDYGKFYQTLGGDVEKALNDAIWNNALNADQIKSVSALFNMPPTGQKTFNDVGRRRISEVIAEHPEIIKQPSDTRASYLLSLLIPEYGNNS